MYWKGRKSAIFGSKFTVYARACLGARGREGGWVGRFKEGGGISGSARNRTGLISPCWRNRMFLEPSVVFGLRLIEGCRSGVGGGVWKRPLAAVNL